MSAAAKKSSPASKVTDIAAKPPLSAPEDTTSQAADPGSKQSRVIAMLQSPTGATIPAMMKTTGHGALNVVPQRVKIELSSKKVDGNRVYRIEFRPCPASAAGPPSKLSVEVARLRDLDVSKLRARWQSIFRRRPPPHLPRHLLYRVLAYRLQAEHLGDLDSEK